MMITIGTQGHSLNEGHSLNVIANGLLLNQGGHVMDRHSEFPIFVQSAAVIIGFILVLSFLGWALQPKGGFQRASAAIGTAVVQ